MNEWIFRDLRETGSAYHTQLSNVTRMHHKWRNAICFLSFTVVVPVLPVKSWETEPGAKRQTIPTMIINIQYKHLIVR